MRPKTMSDTIFKLCFAVISDPKYWNIRFLVVQGSIIRRWIGEQEQSERRRQGKQKIKWQQESKVVDGFLFLLARLFRKLWNPL